MTEYTLKKKCLIVLIEILIENRRMKIFWRKSTRILITIIRILIEI